MKPLILSILTLALPITAVAASHKNYKPKERTGCSNHLRVPFHEPQREWERMDLWVPMGKGPHPCVIVFYGGGYGGKVVPEADIDMLLKSGYAVALPDYALGASSAEPLVVWDGAAAVRWLRANAKRLRIDPERIGAWGFSAGGWLVQRLAPSDAKDTQIVRRPKNKNQDVAYARIPLVEPHPTTPEQPIKLQAFVTDWGAGKLRDKHIPNWLTPDDPPMLTCHNAPNGALSEGSEAYRKGGAVSLSAPMDISNTHVPPGETPSSYKGKPMTWAQCVISHFNEYLKRPTRATAPEAYPAGGPIDGPVEVSLLSPHGVKTIYYTLDGSVPTASSRNCKGSVTVKPGQTLKAVAIRNDLEPSAVMTATFTHGTAAAPRITTKERLIRAAVGKPFSIPMTATGENVVWAIAGHVPVDKDTDSSRPRWAFDVDPKSGVISGTLPEAGHYPIILSARSGLPLDAPQDAVRVVIVAR